MRVDLSVEIDTDDLIWSLRQLTYETKIQFVKDLDASVGDWDFTTALYEFFESEMAKKDEDI